MEFFQKARPQQRLKRKHQPKKLQLYTEPKPAIQKGLLPTLQAKQRNADTTQKSRGLTNTASLIFPKKNIFLAIMSTHGDGEPPVAAQKFYDFVHQNELKLSKLKYGVLALGDSGYPLFCKAGEDLDIRLNTLGGTRLVPLQKCDIDYDVDAEEWFSKVMNSLNDSPSANSDIAAPVVKKSSGKKMYTGRLLSHINLNDWGSNKETFHIEIEAEGVQYLPGDSIGIVPENNKETVEKILLITGTDGSSNIDYKDQLISIFDLLKKKLNILNLPERVVKKYAAVVQQEIPSTKIDLLDLLKIYSVKDSNQFIEVLKILEPITPRQYSIESSPEAHEGEVHITVAKNCFTINNELRHGLASEFLSLLNEEDELQFYVCPNNKFRLPEEDKNIIMIGPGTGIAPFRSFLWERDSNGASGKNWLFFGEQHFLTDFLYQTEIQNWVETSLLTKVDIAFSRDQQEKIYVQHKIKNHASEFFEWLQAGSYVYVCGSKDPMSHDVEETILDVIQSAGERSPEDAKQYLENLKEEGRYVTDVY